MKFWKIKFDGNKKGEGWVQFNDEMEAIAIYDLKGNLIQEAIDYTPIEFDTIPEWA